MSPGPLGGGGCPPIPRDYCSQGHQGPPCHPVPMVALGCWGQFGDAPEGQVEDSLGKAGDSLGTLPAVTCPQGKADAERGRTWGDMGWGDTGWGG